MKIRAVISDSDGTLVNTLYLIRHGQYETAAEYLSELGFPRHDIPSFEIYESFINKSVGGPTRDTMIRTLTLLFGETHKHHLKKVNFDELDSRLAPIQDRLAPLYVHPFYGLTEFFSWIGKNNIALGIFTSGNRRMIIRNFGVSLPVMGYTELFQQDHLPVEERLEAFISRAKAVYGIPEFAVVTCDDVINTKPDPEGILKLLEQLKIKPDEAIVLGDHPVDMKAAHLAGLKGVGITHGFGSPAELKEAGAIRVVDYIGSVPQLIELHNSGKDVLF